MPNLTVRDIPADTLNKIKILSKTERRSTNSEILLIFKIS
jgi:plasmid stability protein